MPVIKPPLGAAITRGRGQTAGLRLFIPMSEGAGQRIADASLNGNAATFSDAANTSWVQSPYGPAILHGAETGGGLTIADADSLDITGPLTFATLARLDVDTYGWLGLFVKAGATTNTTPYEFYRDRNTDRLSMRIMATTRGADDAAATITAGLWYHIAITVDVGLVPRFYVNGCYAGTAAAFPVGPTSSTLPASVGNLWRGAFAGLWLWARALSAGEIRQHYVDPFAMLRPPRLWWQGVGGGATPSSIAAISDYYRRMRSA